MSDSTLPAGVKHHRGPIPGNRLASNGMSLRSTPTEQQEFPRRRSTCPTSSGPTSDAAWSAEVILGTMAAGVPVYFEVGHVAKTDTRPDELLRRIALSGAAHAATEGATL